MHFLIGEKAKQKEKQFETARSRRIGSWDVNLSQNVSKRLLFYFKILFSIVVRSQIVLSWKYCEKKSVRLLMKSGE